MAIVFVILILLNLAMNAMQTILNHRKQEPGPPAVKGKTGPANKTETHGKAEISDANPELFVLLTAAVMAAEGRTQAVRIRSLRLLNDSGSLWWKQVGRIENLQ